MTSINALSRYLPSSLRAILALATLVAVGLLGRSWIASHDQVSQLRASLNAQAKIIRQIEAHQQERREELSRTLAAIARAKKTVKSPAQAAAQIPQLLPAFPDPEPIRVDLPSPPPLQSPQLSELPVPADLSTSAPATAIIPQADLKPLYDYLQDCRACQAQLSATTAELEDERGKVSAITQQCALTTRSAKRLIWSASLAKLKWALIGGAIALAISEIKH